MMMTSEPEIILLLRDLILPGKRSPLFPLISRGKGFTLLELLVAMTIFSLVSITIFSSMTSMIATRDHLEDDNRQLADLQTAFLLIGRDVEQAVSRPVRSGYEESLAAMIWQEAPVSLEFSSNGKRNPAGLKRSSLQRIAYRFEYGRLFRDYWPTLDRPEDASPLSRILLENVENIDITFIGNNEQVYKSWPPDITTPGSPPQPLPRAINLQIAIKDWGKLNRLFLIGRRG